MDRFSFLNAAHTEFFADLYEQYLQNPDSVEPSWRAFFQGFDFGLTSYNEENAVTELVNYAVNVPQNGQVSDKIQKEFNVKLDLSQANQKEQANKYINLYMQKKLALQSGGVKYKMDFVGYEIQKESTWSYFEIKEVKQIKQLNVFCEILFGIDPNQINILHTTVGGVRKSYELTTPKNSTQFNF